MDQAPTNVRPILGPIIIGVVLSGVLYGCATVQTYLYFQRFPRDTWKTKGLVAFEISIQTLHLMLMMAGMWMMVVNDYSEPALLAYIPNPTIITIILCPPIAVVVQVGLRTTYTLSAPERPQQGYFILRVYRLSEEPLLLIFGALLAASKFVLHLVFGISAYVVKDAQRLVHEWGWSITSYLVLSIGCDSLIATSMSYHLNQRKTGFDRTSRIIDKMIIYALGE
ncbi:hypothetical protein ID866_4783 [Astraeus odoratus]|nr:hypothetical protein ID866_4783 [Astraeus odoratus]